jgi:hypothetical protein
VKVLITGSRDWSDREALRKALDDVLAESPAGIILIHGACPSGADALADHWARDRQRHLPILIDRFPANWGSYGRAAGMRRNAEMVAAGADLCLAFFQPGASNRGTAHCAKLAGRAGIPVRRYPAPTTEGAPDA